MYRLEWHVCMYVCMYDSFSRLQSKQSQGQPNSAGQGAGNPHVLDIAVFNIKYLFKVLVIYVCMYVSDILHRFFRND